jgi:putative ABC transport system permease protein
MSALIRDLRHAIRSLAQRPAFSALVIGMLALGIAGNVAIFSIYNGLFLRPLPFEQPDRLVNVDEAAPRWNLRSVGVAVADFYGWHDHNTTFDSMASYAKGSFNLSGRGVAQRLESARVTVDMLKVLRLKPEVGRNFLPEEDRPAGQSRTAQPAGLARAIRRRPQHRRPDSEARCGALLRDRCAPA